MLRTHAARRPGRELTSGGTRERDGARHACGARAGVHARRRAAHATAPPRVGEERRGGWTTDRIVWSIVGLVFLAWAIWAFIEDGTPFVALLGAGLAKGAVVALAALGFVMIIKATGIANFAQGDLITLGAFLGFWATNKTAPPATASVSRSASATCSPLVLMFLLGVAIERVAYAPLQGVPTSTWS